LGQFQSDTEKSPAEYDDILAWNGSWCDTIVLDAHAFQLRKELIIQRKGYMRNLQVFSQFPK